MSDFDDECGKTILKVQDLLKQNQEWESRYVKYAKAIKANLETIKNNKQKFREWPPLYLYMNVVEAKGQMTFSLRYRGQDVAKLKVGTDKIIISTKGFDDKNKRDFGCDIEIKDSEWKSGKAANFRRYFSEHINRTDKSGKRNEEHRIESLLLTEFSKKKSKDKILCNIQPVKFAGITRFQMPTPLSASDTKQVKYSGSRGGGIDIMTRIGTGNAIKLCIMEVKDENDSKEPPAKAIQQGLAYATFMRELLRSDNGEEWWKLFGFSRILPERIELYVACVMPSINNNDTSFADKTINLAQDSFHLHYIYFQEKNNNVVDIATSFKQCSLKSYI
jgi:hypothetical protein